MPFIRIHAYRGRDLELKRKTAQAVVKAASEALGRPEEAFSVVFEDVDKDDWDEQVTKPFIEPLRDKLIIDHGKIV